MGGIFYEDGNWEYGTHRFQGRKNIAEGPRRLEPPRPGLIRRSTFSPIIHFEAEKAHSWADNIALMISAEGVKIVSAAYLAKAAAGNAAVIQRIRCLQRTIIMDEKNIVGRGGRLLRATA